MKYIFLDKRFPVDISYGSSGGPEYNTEILMTTNGFEYRNSKWKLPKLRFNVAIGIKNHKQMEQILAFFRNCKGRQTGFRYKDWSDFKCTQEPIQVINSQRGQLIKTYTLDEKNFDRRTITKPVHGSVKVYLNSMQLKEDLWTVDYSTGEISFINKINSKMNITADFEFDIHARFDTDFLPVTVESYQFYSTPDIPVIEIQE